MKIIEIYSDESRLLELQSDSDNEYIPVLYDVSDEEAVILASGHIYDNEQDATDAARILYHSILGDLKPGSTGHLPYQLFPTNWKNAEIYKDTPDDDKNLIEALEDGKEIEPVTINKFGVPIKGNRRIRCATIINEKLRKEDKEPLFLTIPYQVKDYQSEAQEIRALTRDNEAQRKRNRNTITQSISYRLLQSFYAVQADRHLSLALKERHGTITDEERKEREKLASSHNTLKQMSIETEISEGALAQQNRLDKFGQEFKEDAELVDLIQQVREKFTPNRAEGLTKNYRKHKDRDAVIAAANKILSGDKPVGAESAIEAVAAEREQKKITAVVGDETDPYVLMETHQGRQKLIIDYKLSKFNEFTTPCGEGEVGDMIDKFFKIVSGHGVDTDAFSDFGRSYCPGGNPIKHYITAVEDALNPKTKITGNVFANVTMIGIDKDPYSALAREIDSGNIERLITISEYHLLDTTSFFPTQVDAGILFLHDKMLMHPSKFIDQPVRDKLRVVMSFYSRHEKDHIEFANHFQSLGKYYRQVQPTDISMNLIDSEWVNNCLYVFDTNVRITSTKKEYGVVVNGDKILTLPKELGETAVKAVAIAKAYEHHKANSNSKEQVFA